MTFWRWSASVPAWLALALACLPIRAAEVALTPVEQEILLAVFVEDSGSQSTRQTVLLEATSIRRIARPPGDYDRFCANLRKEAQGRDAPFREALEDLLRKNREPAKMTFPTNLPPVLTNTVLLSQARADALIGGADKADWREFEARFPQAHGLGTVSRIGLNAEQTVALVYYGTTRGPLSGMGTIHVLRLRNGKWTMTYESFGPGWRS